MAADHELDELRGLLDAISSYFAFDSTGILYRNSKRVGAALGLNKELMSWALSYSIRPSYFPSSDSVIAPNFLGFAPISRSLFDFQSTKHLVCSLHPPMQCMQMQFSLSSPSTQPRRNFSSGGSRGPQFVSS